MGDFCITLLTGTYGIMSLNVKTGLYEYKLDDALAQQLGQYQTVKDTFTIRVVDGAGAWTEREVTVTIHGTLDKPTISYAAANVSEDGGHLIAPGVISTSGSLSVKTVDGVHKEQTFEVVTANGAPPSSTGQSDTEITITGKYGTLVFDTKDGSYTYTLSPEVNKLNTMQAKNIGELFGKEEFIVRITFPQDKNAFGGPAYSADTTLIIDITGTNDAPQITANQPALTGTAMSGRPEYEGDTATGVILATDVDNISAQQATGAAPTELFFGFWRPDTAGNNPTSDADMKVPNGGQYFQNIQTASGYGSVYIDMLTGKYTYTVNNLNAAVQNLAKDATLTDTFTVWVRDKYGAWATENVTITITGRDYGAGGLYDNYELPTVELVVSEDSALSQTDRPVSGTVTPGLEDSSGTPSSPTQGTTAIRYCFKDASGNITFSRTNDYGTIYIDSLTGQYRYVLNNQSDAVQALATSALITESFDVFTFTNTSGTYTFTDTNKDIVVKIEGINDDPALTHATQAPGLNAYAGTAGLKTEGLFTAKDVDTGDTFTYSLSAEGVFTADQTLALDWGNIAIDNTGKYVFTFDPTKTLSGNTTVKFWVHVSDGHGGYDKEEVTIHITAQNAKPLVVSCHYENTDGNVIPADSDAYGKSPNLSIDTDNGDIQLDGSDLNTSTATALKAGLLETTANIEGKFGAWDHEVAQTAKPADSLKFFLKTADGKLVSLMENEYGTLELQADGSFLFTLNVRAEAVQKLGDGDKKVLNYMVVVRDAGGLISDPQDFNITITGTNNQPEITFRNGFHFTNGGDLLQEHSFSMKDPDFDKAEADSFSLKWTGQNGSEVTASPVTTSSDGYTLYTFTLSETIDGVLHTYGTLTIKMNPNDLHDTNMKYWFDLDQTYVDTLKPDSNISLNLSISFNDGSNTATSNSGAANIGIIIQGKPGPVTLDDTANNDSPTTVSLTLTGEGGRDIDSAVNTEHSATAQETRMAAHDFADFATAQTALEQETTEQPAPAPLAAAATALVSDQVGALGSPDTTLPGDAPAPLMAQAAGSTGTGADTHAGEGAGAGTAAQSGPAQPITLETPLDHAPLPDMTSAPGQEALQFQLQTTGM